MASVHDDVDTDDYAVVCIDRNIVSIDQLQLHRRLQSINLHGNSLTRISALSQLIHLRHLDLSSNLITVIEGLGGCKQLKYLNLSCNKICRLQGLDRLSSLHELNLSYNYITSLDGLGVRGGPALSLDRLFLQGNRLASLDDILDHLACCSALRVLMLVSSDAGNPVCLSPEYRVTIWNQLSSLQVLDCRLHDGTWIDEELVMFDSDFSFSNDKPSPHLPIGATVMHEAIQVDESTTDTKKPCQETTQVEPAAMVERLPTLMEKACQTFPGNTTRHCENRSRDGSDCDSPAEAAERTGRGRVPGSCGPACNVGLGRDEKAGRSAQVSGPSASSSSCTEMQVLARRSQIPRLTTRQPSIKNTEKDPAYMGLLKELDLERERRWKSEQANRKLGEMIRNLQLNVKDAESREATELERVALLQVNIQEERLHKESTLQENHELSSLNMELQGKIHSLELRLNQKESALLDSTKNASDLQETITLMEEETRKLKQQHDIELLTLRREITDLKVDLSGATAHLRDAEAALSKHMEETSLKLKNMIEVNGAVFLTMIDAECARRETLTNASIKDMQQRLETASKAYRDLEDEFRTGLKMEARRYHQQQHVCANLTRENTTLRMELQNVAEREQRASIHVFELQTSINELRLQLSEAAKDREHTIQDQQESTKAELGKLRDQVQTLHTQLEGLQVESRGQKVSLKGLAPDQKEKLYKKINETTSELAQTYARIQEADRLVALKSKIIEDQSDTIIKLKQELAEQAGLADLCREQEAELTQLRDHTADLEERNQKLDEDMVALEEQLQADRKDLKSVKRKWAERMTVISSLEVKLETLQAAFSEKESRFQQENDRLNSLYSKALLDLESVQAAHEAEVTRRISMLVAEHTSTVKGKDDLLKATEARVLQVEAEMRLLLQQSASTKQSLERRIGFLSQAFSKIQQDLQR